MGLINKQMEKICKFREPWMKLLLEGTDTSFGGTEERVFNVTGKKPVISKD